jgi:hypothetical protein
MKPTNLIHRSLALLSGRLLLVALDAHAQPPIVPEEVPTAGSHHFDRVLERCTFQRNL